MKSKLIIVFSLCTFLVLCLSACTPKYVYYKGVEIESSKLSKDTINWLEKYNAETEEVQNTISYLPPELITVLTEMGYDVVDKKSEEVVFEKPTNVITKILVVEKVKEPVISEDGSKEVKEIGRFLIYTDDLYWCEYENIDKLKAGYSVEILYSEGIKTDGDILTIVPDSVTIISGTYNYFGLYLDVIESLWNEKPELNQNISNVLIDFADFKFFSDNHKTALFYLLNSKYNVEFKEGSEETQGENDLVIRLYLGDSNSEDYLYNLSAVKTKNETDFVKFTNCVVKNIENQLIWEKK